MLCILGGSAIDGKRNAAVMAAYSLSESSFREYREKVRSSIGNKKEQDVVDGIAEEQLSKNPVKESQIVRTGKGTTLCYESLSGRYFISDINDVKRAVNNYNEKLLRDDFVILNDLYYELGLEDTKLGEVLGWDLRDGQLEARYSSKLASNGDPCLVINYFTLPKIYR